MTNSEPQSDEFQKQIRLDIARWRLALLWFCGSGALFLLLVFLSLSPIFDGRTQDLFGWALPNFLPTLALMISVFAATALVPAEKETVLVRSNFFYLSFGLSAFYLLLLFAPLVVPVLVSGEAPTAERRLERLEQSNIFLGPVQGLVVMALGVLFFLKDTKKSQNPVTGVVEEPPS